MTATSWLTTTCAPTATGCAGSNLDPGLRELQALVRLREDHVRARTAASNQLGALLDAYWPGPKAMFCKLASDIALAFLTDYPTPQAAARLGQARLAGFCRRHAYRAASHPPNSLARLRAAPIPSSGLAPCGARPVDHRPGPAAGELAGHHR